MTTPLQVVVVVTAAATTKQQHRLSQLYLRSMAKHFPSANSGQLNKSLHKQKHTDFTALVDVPFLEFTSIGVVVGSSATFREISTGRVLILLSGATSSLISFTWVCSMIGDRSVALITATLSGTSFLAPDYKTINRISYNITYNHLLLCILSCLALVLEKINYTTITNKQGRI